MTEPRTIVVLDGHPSTISLTVAPPDPNLTGLPQLPPFPLWSSIVDGTLGFCRIAWDLCRPDHAPVQVLVAKQETQVLNSWRDIDQSLVKVSNGFRAAQPNSPLLPSDKPRLAAAIKDAFMALLLNKGPPLPPWRRFRIVLVILRKRPDEVGYMYRDNEDDKEAVNLKSLVFEALHTLAPDKLSTIKHVQVDVLRLLPSNESLTDMLPCQISPQLTLSVYNVPNGRHDLHQAMINLAQQYYNINHLLVSNIPMKTKADLAHPNQTTTKSVEFYYQAGCQHRLDPKTPTSESRLHHPDFLKERTTNLLYLKRSKRSDSGWCTCMHAISPIKPSDPPTEVFLEMILKGSSSYLVTAEAHETNKKTWTHMLMEHQGGVYLRCLDRQTEALFSKAEGVPIKQDPERHNVKQEPDGGIGIGGGGGITPIKKELFVKDEFGPPVPIIEDRPSVPVAVTLPKPAVNVSAATLQEFMDSCVRPCVFESYEQFLGVSGPGNPCELVPFNPFRYSHQDTLPALLSTMATKDNKVFTNQYLERAARWRTCMRDCNGTDKFPVNLEARSIASCSVDVLNGSPLGTGFGVASGLVNDLFEQLEGIVLQDQIRDMQAAEGLVDMLIDELSMALRGTPKNVFPKSLRGKPVQLLAKKLLLALQLVAKRFMDNSPSHTILCTRLLTMITQKTVPKEQQEQLPVQKPVNTTQQDSGIEMAWRQSQHYQNMSHREREDAVITDGMDSNLNKDQGFKSQNRGQPGINPLFRGRRGKGLDNTGPAVGNNNNNSSIGGGNNNGPDKIKYPGPSAMYKSYLDMAPPTIEEKAAEEAEEEKALGVPQSIHWAYWKTRQIRKRGFREEKDPYDGTELVHKQGGGWQRAKKEFDSRLPVHGGEQGELI